ncbi:MAG: long-chain-acyl-CoA synthetase [Pseudomonadales bacterium]|nr:long-chain-acyl-CoA synthetase [Pseudomonadales bacterium]
MPVKDLVAPMDLVRHSPEMIKRIPSVIRMLNAKRNESEHDCMPRYFENTVRKYPDRPAIYYLDRSITYRQLNEQANKVAHYLRDRGLKRGDVVAMLMHNRPEFLICLMAVSKMGACAALLNTAQTGKVLSYSINLVEPRMFILGSELSDVVVDIQSELKVENDLTFAVADVDTLFDPGSTPAFTNLIAESRSKPAYNLIETSEITRDDHYVYLYTSGTTGMPKAAITDHNRICWMFYLVNVVMQLKPKDIYYVPLPLFHATGLLACWTGTVSAGASIVIKRKFSASEFWDDINLYQATVFGYVGELCRYLLNQPSKPTDGQHTLKKMFGNGFRPGLWEEFKTRFKVTHIIEGYGSSEGNVGFMNMFNLDNTVGVGKATLVKYDKDKEELVRDAKGYLILAEKGEPGLLLGEITEKTPFVGYTQKDKTESAILRNAFKPGDAWFNTGDLLKNIGCKHYQFVDRLGDTFRWKGENVSTTEVERIISNHPDVAHCAVYGEEIPNTNGKAGMATITPIEGRELAYDNLYQFLGEQLPPYAVPVFVRIKTKLDTTDSFKYKKVDLKKDGYKLEKSDDPIFVALPKTTAYVPLTQEIEQGINSEEYRF